MMKSDCGLEGHSDSLHLSWLEVQKYCNLIPASSVYKLSERVALASIATRNPSPAAIIFISDCRHCASELPRGFEAAWA